MGFWGREATRTWWLPLDNVLGTSNLSSLSKAGQQASQTCDTCFLSGPPVSSNVVCWNLWPICGPFIVFIVFYSEYKYYKWVNTIYTNIIAHLWNIYSEFVLKLAFILDWPWENVPTFQPFKRPLLNIPRAGSPFSHGNIINGCHIQWPCNSNRLIGGTDSIYKAYFWGLCKGISPQNMALI